VQLQQVPERQALQPREPRLLAQERQLLVLKRQVPLRQVLQRRARPLRAQPMLLQPPAWQMRRASGQTTQMKKW
jgi:hypothetical protein